MVRFEEGENEALLRRASRAREHYRFVELAAGRDLYVGIVLLVAHAPVLDAYGPPGIREHVLYVDHYLLCATVALEDCLLEAALGEPHHAGLAPVFGFEIWLYEIVVEAAVGAVEYGDFVVRAARPDLYVGLPAPILLGPPDGAEIALGVGVKVDLGYGPVRILRNGGFGRAG